MIPWHAVLGPRPFGLAAAEGGEAGIVGLKPESSISRFRVDLSTIYDGDYSSGLVRLIGIPA